MRLKPARQNGSAQDHGTDAVNALQAEDPLPKSIAGTAMPIGMLLSVLPKAETIASVRREGSSFQIEETSVRYTQRIATHSSACFGTKAICAALDVGLFDSFLPVRAGTQARISRIDSAEAPGSASAAR